MQTEKKCSKCKKGLNGQQIGLFFLSFFILITSVYGSYHLFKNLISLFY
jgi:hypothetical protein